MLDVHHNKSSGGAVGDKIVPLVVLAAAAGIGCLVLSRTRAQQAADGIARLGRSMRRWLPNAAEQVGNRTDRAWQACDDGAARGRIRTEEPIAGYGP
jgi:hypothetical protein